MKKIALIAGTSGLIGMQLLHQLIKDGSYDLILSAGRRKLALKHPKLVQIEGDLGNMQSWDISEKLREEDLGGSHFSLIEALEKGALEIHAFCSLGTTIKNAGSQKKFYEIDHDYVIKFALMAKELGAVKFLYVSAMGADPMSKVFYNRVKGEVEEDLKVIPFSYLGLFRPSLLLGQRKEFRFGEEMAKIFSKPLVWFKLMKKYRPIYDHQVAKAMIHFANLSTGDKVQVIENKQMLDF